jgi:phospholipid-binding lipoprotein MlaA
VFVRDAYLQRRRSLVYDGNEPESEEDSFEADPEPPAAAASQPAAASAPAAAAASAPDAPASQPSN